MYDDGSSRLVEHLKRTFIHTFIRILTCTSHYLALLRVSTCACSHQRAFFKQFLNKRRVWMRRSFASTCRCVRMFNFCAQLHAHRRTWTHTDVCRCPWTYADARRYMQTVRARCRIINITLPLYCACLDWYGTCMMFARYTLGGIVFTVHPKLLVV